MTVVDVLDNGAVAWVSALLPLLSIDGARVRNGLRSLSAIARDHPRTTLGGLAYLTLHLLRPSWMPEWWVRLDPLSAAAGYLAPRS